MSNLLTFDHVSLKNVIETAKHGGDTEIDSIFIDFLINRGVYSEKLTNTFESIYDECPDTTIYGLVDHFEEGSLISTVLKDWSLQEMQRFLDSRKK